MAKVATSYDRIEAVLAQEKRNLAPHEFRDVKMKDDGGSKTGINALQYVGCSERSLLRRMQEGRGDGRFTSQIRSGKKFAEYGLLSWITPAKQEAATV